MSNAPGNGEGGTSSKSDAFQQQFEEIQTLLQSPECKKLFNIVKGEDIAMFIGNTRAGKSTLINFAIGNQLKAVKKDDFPPSIRVVKADDQENGPIIGLESVSETTFPFLWSASRSGLKGKVVDAPGFEDNRGEAQDIANTFYIKEIMRNAKSVKFVLITDINDILNQNVSNFTNFFDKMHRIFPDTNILHGGIALVFSKVTGKCSEEDICGFLNKSILDQKDMKVEKSLIKYFTEHKDCMTFFRMPLSEGLLTGADIGKNILDVIDNKLKGISGKMLSDVKPGISDKSKIFLIQSFADFCNGAEYSDLLQQIKDSFAMKCRDMSLVRTVEEFEKLHKVMEELENKFLQLFPKNGAELSFANLLEKLGSMCQICGVKSKLDNSNISVYLQFVEFLDQILVQNNREICIDKFRSTIEVINNTFNYARLILEMAQNKISELEAEKRRREIAEEHSKKMEALVEKMAACCKQNEKRAAEQAQKLGWFGKVGKYAKSMFQSTGTFLDDTGESLDGFFDTVLPSRNPPSNNKTCVLQ